MNLLVASGLSLALFAFQSATPPGPQFEVASIKPDKSASQGMRLMMQPGGRFVGNNLTVKFLVEYAYDIKDSQLSGAPSWMDSERYDVDAKPDETTSAAINKMSRDEVGVEMRKMMQALLADRFKLAVTHETKDLPVYALVVAKSGPKIHQSTEEPLAPDPNGPPPGPPGPGQRRQGIMLNGRGEMTLTAVPLRMFADTLSRIVGRVVIDKTGLTGNYDFTLKWTPEQGEGLMGPPGAGPGGGASAPPPDASGPSIYTAVQEQLGLKLESQKAPTDCIVIQHVERPSEN